MTQSQISNLDTCLECGGIKLNTADGQACSCCGLVYPEIVFLVDDMEGRYVSYEGRSTRGHEVACGTQMGNAVERGKVKNPQHKRFKKLTVNQNDYVFGHDQRFFKSHFQMTPLEFGQWINKINNTIIPKFQRYNYWIIFLFQIIYNRASITQIRKIFMLRGHKSSHFIIRQICLDHNFSLPRRNWFAHYKAICLEKWPKIKGHQIPKLPKSYKFNQKRYIPSDKIYYAALFAIMINDVYIEAAADIAKFFKISCSHLYMVAQSTHVWRHHYD